MTCCDKGRCCVSFSYRKKRSPKMEIAGFADVLGTLLIGLALIILVYAICSSCISDETLYDKLVLARQSGRELVLSKNKAIEDKFIN